MSLMFILFLWNYRVVGLTRISIIVPVSIITIITTFAVMIVSGKVTQFVLRKEPKMVNQLVLNTATIEILISIIGFEIGVFLRDRYKWPIFNPLLVAIIFVIIVLNVFNIDYDSYYASADNLSYLLTPATVA